MADLDPSRYGVIVTSGGRRGLLLPDLEGVDDVATQVAIALQKAGIPENTPCSLERFLVDRYTEPMTPYAAPPSKWSQRADAPASETRVLAIVGPTGVGKTAVAEEVAVRLGGEIVSADSMQIYRGMDIGTAKPPRGAAARALLVHRPRRPGITLLGGALPAVGPRGDRGHRRAFHDPGPRGRHGALRARRPRRPVISRRRTAGQRGPQVLRAVRGANGAPALYELLLERDPESAAVIHQNNTRRVVRALEMLDGGVPYAEQRIGFSTRKGVLRHVFVGLTMDRERLYGRIDARVDAMIAAGLLGRDRGTSRRRPASDPHRIPGDRLQGVRAGHRGQGGP